MDLTKDEVVEILAEHQERYRVHPASYQVYAHGDNPEGWVAHVFIWEETSKALTIHKVWGKADLRFPTKEEADAHSYWLAADWLVNNT